MQSGGAALTRRLKYGIAALVAALAASGVGYAFGASRAPDRREATAVYRGASLAAFPGVYQDAFTSAWKEGYSAGVAKGMREGLTFGSERGVSDADASVQRRVNALAKKARDGGREPEVQVPAAGQEVLVVGDSLEVLTSPYLPRHLSGVKLTVNAIGGYNSLQLFELFQESYDPAQSVIVFDAGTNDNPNYPEILAGRLAAVADIVGDRCMVVPSIHGLMVEGTGDAGKNRTVASFAASRPGTQVPDWAGAVATHPELMQSDDLHPNVEGADYRASLIAEGVKACLQFNASFPPELG